MIEWVEIMQEPQVSHGIDIEKEILYALMWEVGEEPTQLKLSKCTSYDVSIVVRKKNE